MELLESDNYHDDPHADLVMSKGYPNLTIIWNREAVERKRKNVLLNIIKLSSGRISSSWWMKIEPAEVNKRVSYMDIQCEESPMPPRHFCAAYIQATVTLNITCTKLALWTTPNVTCSWKMITVDKIRFSVKNE
ncbi:hypothetical protein NQ317_012386 [Molorchus minor]|uniref:Uncharacterized protein n=1 Tax=Molorchus minor TaxID=1323400 RepID=A0ABQ9IQ32_9CUCU|nr:hypothetical protein NQ317_012386 [Molorchus minor]